MMNNTLKSLANGDFEYHDEIHSDLLLKTEWARSGRGGLWLRMLRKNGTEAGFVMIAKEDVAKWLKKAKQASVRTSPPVKCDRCGGKGKL